MELKKDDRRPLSEPSTTNVIYAPHAASSDVGLAEASWTPDVANNGKELKPFGFDCNLYLYR